MATTGGQTINDRLNAVRYALVGQGLARTVCKATTEEVLGPKKKHIDYLLACTNEPNVSIPQMANLLIERTQHTSWAVVFKALTTIHHLMSFGNERFTQYLATSNHSFELADFMDRTTPQGYNMSNFVRRYAKYINDKSISYRTLAIDLCKIKSGNDNALRTMNMDNLSKTLPIVQSQFDSLLEFNVESKDLNNGIIMAAFRLLYKDLVRLYIAYQEAIINLLERYFKLSRKKTREALEMYRNYLNRMDKVDSFLRIVEAVGLDKSEMPDLTKSPASILKLLEQHLASLEAKKRGTTPAGEEEGATTSREAEEGNEQQQQEALTSTPTTSKEDKENIPPEDGSLKGVNKKVEPTTSQVPVIVKQPQQQAKSSSPLESGQSQNQTKQPPAKPNRPVTPEVSPKSKDGRASGGPSASSDKKAAPPERPAKPPSRPPPPSASSPVEQAGKRTGSPATTSTGDSPKVPAASRPTPPPHPPPPPASSSSHPTTSSTPSSSSTTTAAAAAAATAATSRPAQTSSDAPATQATNSLNQNGQEQNATTANQQESNGIPEQVRNGALHNSNHDSNDKDTDQQTTTASCSNVSNVNGDQETLDRQNVENGQDEAHSNVESNHVLANNNDENHNNSNNHHGLEAEEMQSPPPPPPPLEEEEMPPPPPPPPPMEEHEVAAEQEEEGGEQAPITNGSSNNAGNNADQPGVEGEQIGDLGIADINLEDGGEAEASQPNEP